MRTLGILTVWTGLILSVIGIVIGFWQLSQANEAALMWLSLVPLGFIGLLFGVTLSQLAKKE